MAECSIVKQHKTVYIHYNRWQISHVECSPAATLQLSGGGCSVLEACNKPLNVIKAGVEDGHISLILLTARWRHIVVVAHTGPFWPWSSCLTPYLTVSWKINEISDNNWLKIIFWKFYTIAGTASGCHLAFEKPPLLCWVSALNVKMQVPIMVMC